MAYSFAQKITGIIFRPARTFRDLEDEPFGRSLVHFLKITFLFSVFMTIVAYSILNFLMPKKWSMATQLIQPQYFFVVLLIMAVIIPLIIGIWLHIWVYLFGGRRGIGQTLKTVMYSCTLFFIIAWIPIIGFFGGALSTLYPQKIGIEELHHISSRRATGAICVTALLTAVAFAGVLVMAVIAPASTLSFLPSGSEAPTTPDCPYLLTHSDLPESITYFSTNEVDSKIITRDAKELGCLKEYTETYAEEKPSSATSRRIMHFVMIFPPGNASMMVQRKEEFYRGLVPPRNAETLPALDIGDHCASYKVPGVSSASHEAYDSYCIIFSKGDVYEKFVTIGPSPDYDLLKDLALKAAAKIP